jgi:hypothetical protein
MKRLLTILTFALFLAASTSMVFAQDFGHQGPAPNAGDGVPDGSGFDAPIGPYGNDSTSGNGPAGPAPNAGDGIPDGSGFDCPNGPNGQ